VEAFDAEEGLLGEGDTLDGEELLGVDGLVDGDEVLAEAGDLVEIFGALGGVGSVGRELFVGERLLGVRHRSTFRFER
jgi:predicted polyphosphate/ATP-dependent NAD kinase